MEQSSRKNSAAKANRIQSASPPAASPQPASPHLPAPASPPQPTTSRPRDICSPSFESHRSFSLEEDEERVPYCMVKSHPRVLWASNRGGCPHGEPMWGSAGQNQQPPCLSSSVSSWEKCQQSSLASQGAGSAGDFCEARGESHHAEPPFPGLMPAPGQALQRAWLRGFVHLLAAVLFAHIPWEVRCSGSWGGKRLG